MGEFNQTKYITDYQREHYDEIKIRAYKGAREKWKAAAQAAGTSVNAFVIETVEAEIQRRFPDLSESKSE